MKAAGKRAAVKLGGCVLLAFTGLLAITLGDDMTPWRAMLYAAAVAVCIRILWPTQEEGDDLVNGDDD